ncbi:MAG: hypothetical protein ACYDFT_06290 [Thermoplasmata archaeon]
MRLCAGGGAYEAVPRPRLSLDLADLKSRLESAGFSVLDARVMLVIRRESEATISRDGRILIKTRDPAEAERILADLLERLGLPTAPTPA